MRGHYKWDEVLSAQGRDISDSHFWNQGKLNISAGMPSGCPWGQPKHTGMMLFRGKAQFISSP